MKQKIKVGDFVKILKVQRFDTMGYLIGQVGVVSSIKENIYNPGRDYCVMFSSIDDCFFFNQNEIELMNLKNDEEPSSKNTYQEFSDWCAVVSAGMSGEPIQMRYSVNHKWVDVEMRDVSTLCPFQHVRIKPKPKTVYYGLFLDSDDNPFTSSVFDTEV